jgi:diacylglycerol kinase family enzyme
MTRAAVVVNPTKLDDDEAFRKSVRQIMDDHGWDEPLWLETTPDDPGRGQAESAVSAGVDLVLACGGDGTVTACAEGVTGTGVPLAIIPMGTGNLLARNVGVPMGMDEALAVALGGVQQPIDAGRVNGTLFVVMAGLGRWLAVAAGIVLRRSAHGRIYRVQFTKLQVTLDREQTWELDGEVMKSTRQLTVVAQPGALLLRMPPESA